MTGIEIAFFAAPLAFFAFGVAVFCMQKLTPRPALIQSSRPGNGRGVNHHRHYPAE
jgi:hypothetical protein